MKIHYIGPRFDPADPESALAVAQAALDDYNRQADVLHYGRKPNEDTGGLTVQELANKFLNAKQARVEAGELSPRTWACRKEACDAVVASFGESRLVADLDPEGFASLRNKLARRYGPYGLGTRIQCIRSVFKYARDAGLIDRPMRFGPEFKRPSKKTLRIHRARQGAKFFTAEKIRGLIDAAGVQPKAMILLGINCGLGPADCGTLPRRALDLDQCIIDFPRPKTGIARRCPLWPETVQALREVLAARKEPKDPAGGVLSRPDLLERIPVRGLTNSCRSQPKNVAGFLSLPPSLLVQGEGEKREAAAARP